MSSSFHFVSLRFAKPKRFLTMVDPVGKPRIVTFKDRSTADNAVRYMSRFMAKHGEWPIMDLSPDSNLNKVTKKEKPGDPDTEALMLDVVEYEQDDIERMAMSTNASFVWVQKFDVLPTRHHGMIEQVAFSGNEINAIVDDDCFRDTLEHLVV